MYIKQTLRTRAKATTFAFTGENTVLAKQQKNSVKVFVIVIKVNSNRLICTNNSKHKNTDNYYCCCL